MASSFRRFVGRVAVGALAVAVPVVMTPLAGVGGRAHRPVHLRVRRGLEQQQGARDLQRHRRDGRPRGGSYNVQVFANGAATADAHDRPHRHGRGRRRLRPRQHVAPAPRSSPQADQTSGSANWSTATTPSCCARAAHRSISTSFGQIGVDPGTEWGTGLTTTVDNTLRRKASVCAGDTDGTDAFDPAAQWDGFAIDTFDGLGAHTADCGPAAGRRRPAVAVHRPRPTGVDRRRRREPDGHLHRAGDRRRRRLHARRARSAAP